MSATTLLRPPFEAVLAVPKFSAESHFALVGDYVEESLRRIGGDGSIVDPALSMLEKPWHAENPEDAVANRHVIIEAVSALPDALSAGAAISEVTGTFTDPLAIALTNILQDVAKPPRLSRESQTVDVDWLRHQRIAMMVHVVLAKEMVEQSALPAFYGGNPLRQLVADALGEHHGWQPEPSFIYGCGHPLGNEGRRVRDAVANSDWFGAKFYRQNRGNQDEFGIPLPYDVRSRQFGAYLLFCYKGNQGKGGYWHVSEANNPDKVAQGVYSAIKNNHPSIVLEAEEVFDGHLQPMQQSKSYINVTHVDFSGSSSLEDLPLAS